jgi:hypothetical protein
MMKWLIDDLKSALEALKRGATWLVIGILVAFGLISFVIAHFAFQTDSVLRFLRISVVACREMTNGPIIFMISGMIFCGLAAVATFGEIQRYYHFRDRNSPTEARQAAIEGVLWGGFAMAICLGALIFFKMNCS